MKLAQSFGVEKSEVFRIAERERQINLDQIERDRAERAAERELLKAKVEQETAKINAEREMEIKRTEDKSFFSQPLIYSPYGYWSYQSRVFYRSLMKRNLF